MEALWNKQYKLAEFTDPDGGRFKTYEELKTKMTRVLGLSGDSVEPKIDTAEDVKLPWEGKPNFDTKDSEVIDSTEVDDKFTSADKDDTVSYFEKLANG